METPYPEEMKDVLVSLWLRLSTVAIIGLLFFFVLLVPERLSGWRFYLTAGEVAFEVTVFAVFTALAAVALGAFCAAVVAPFLFFREPSTRRHTVEAVTRIAVAIAGFVDLGMATKVLGESIGLRGDIVLVCYCVAFAFVFRSPRQREQVVTSLDGFLGRKATRRAVIGTGVAAAALAAAEAAMGRLASAPAMPARTSRPAGPNILLITFDALNAEDMSLYGYRLPTTPHIDEFARNSSVFTNFYSASAGTTTSVAAMLTGLEPSENHVYHLQGRLRGPQAGQTLPRLMRAAGYSTGASITNPFAYFLAQGIASDYDFLPEPPYRATNFMRAWDATQILHQREPFGSRTDEFFDLEKAWDVVPDGLERLNPRLFGRTRSEFPPAGSFEQARQILERMPDGFFLWVHLFAPHWPYLPDANLGRFLPSGEMRTMRDQNWPGEGPDDRGLVRKARLRYDEFLADADSAFGAFQGGLESAGRLRNTAVIFSADHGESFEGGVYGHGNRNLTRPEIHVPLIIRVPGQERGSRVAVTADHTALAPTILDIAGVPRGVWMRGPSLGPWLNRDGEGGGQGLAFTQYLETNNVFKPLHRGTVGVIDGRNQYVLDLATGKGVLRGLAEAHLRDVDRSAGDPAAAQALRDAIYMRFPDLPRVTPT